MSTLPVATPRATRKAVRDLIRPHRTLGLVAVTVLLAATAAGLATAPLLGHIVDLVVAHRSPGVRPAVLLIAAALTQGALLGAGTGLVATLGERALARLRERFVDRALRLPLEQLERAGSGDLTSRVGEDVAVITEAVRNALPAMSRSVLTIALTLAAMAVLDWRFQLAAVLAVPIQLHTVHWYARRAGPLYARQRAAVGAQQHQLLDTIGAAATVRAFRRTNDHLDRVATKSGAAVELTITAARLWTRFYSRLNLAEFVGLAGVLTTGFLLVRAGDVSVGTATAAALYFHGLFNPINVALALVDDAQAATASLGRLVGVAELPVSQRNQPPAGTGVSVTGLRYAYRPGHEVLHGIDLEIRPGERVALVGASGAGKTTVAKLIAGIHPPSAGTIRAAATVLVTQEVHVFAGSLAEDLRLADPDATDQDLVNVLERVTALDWVRLLPKGIETVVGEGGHRLTAAQSQQLALCRLVLADPPVAILDEATAEAGSAGAIQLEAAAAAALAGRSALIVAHRLSQAVSADRVVVLEHGRVVESGTHDELVAAGGPYAALWLAWSTSKVSLP